MLLIIPALAILGFLFIARRLPVFILGVPLVYAFWEAAFIPQTSLGRGSFTITPEDILFALFFLAWLFLSLQRRPTRFVRIHPEIWLMLLFMAYLLLEVLLSWMVKNTITYGSLLELRPYIYWPLGLFLWLAILSRVTTEELMQFIDVFSWLTTAFMVLYILSAIGVHIYPGSRHDIITTASGIVVRDFVTFPYWALWALFYFVLKISYSAWSKRSFLQLLGVAILMAGVLLSLTKSMVFIVLFIFVIFTIYFLIYGRQGRIKYIGFLIIALLGVTAALLFFAPGNVQIFLNGVMKLQGGIATSSLGTRFKIFANLVKFLKHRDPVFGVGFYTNPKSAPVRFWGDMMWLRIIFSLGYVGIILFGVFLLISLFRSIKIIFLVTSKNIKILSWLFFQMSIFNLLIALTSESYTSRYSISLLAAAGILLIYDRVWNPAPANHLSQPQAEKETQI